MRKTPRFYLGEALALGQYPLPQDVTHHSLKVLRLQPGQEVILFNGDGNDYHARITELPKRGPATVDIYDISANGTESNLQLHLAQALSRKETMNVAIQKAVELGVSTITPLITEFTDAKLEPTFLEKRCQQWQKVIISASEQCGRATLTELVPAQSLTTWCEQTQQSSAANSDTTLNLYLDVTQGVSLRSLHQEQVTEHAINQVNIVVGPEGGFSTTEVALLQESGFTAINLGPRVLRFETAAITALAVVQSIWGDY